MRGSAGSGQAIAAPPAKEWPTNRALCPTASPRPDGVQASSRRAVVIWSSVMTCSCPVRRRSSRSVPGGRYGRWGRKKITSSGGRTSVPTPAGQMPAVARNRAVRAASFGPTTNTLVPRGMYTVRFLSTSRPPSGENSVSPSYARRPSASTTATAVRPDGGPSRRPRPARLAGRSRRRTTRWTGTG